MNILNKNKKLQSGVSLIEILIALAIAMFLLIGIVSLFSNNKRIYREQDQMGRLQENARFATELLIKDIRMAGYSGCHDDIGEVVNHLNKVDDEDDDEATYPPDTKSLIYFGNSVEGYESTATTPQWEPSTSTDEKANFVAGTDAITIRYMLPSGLNLVSPYMTAASAALHLSTGSGLKVDDIIAVTDCTSTDLFQITGPTTIAKTLNHNTGAVSDGPGNDFKNLSKTYGAGAEIVRFIAKRYFIGTGSKGPALFMKENYDDAVELIEGVESMQILYGEDTDATADGVANLYRDAEDVASWNRVVSVRMALLVRTPDQIFTSPLNTNAYKLLDTDVYTVGSPPNDNYSRRIFNLDVSIRNRAN